MINMQISFFSSSTKYTAPQQLIVIVLKQFEQLRLVPVPFLQIPANAFAQVLAEVAAVGFLNKNQLIKTTQK